MQQMTEGFSASGVAILLLTLALTLMFRGSVWLISRKYAVVTFIVHSLLFGVVIWNARHDVFGVAVVVLVYLFIVYIIYYKYTMKESFLKQIKVPLLTEKNRKEKLPAGWLFIYMPHALFICMSVLFILIYIYPGTAKM